MNAPFANKLTALACKLAHSEATPLYDEQSFYSDAEWRDAGLYSLDTGDYDELSFMLAQQRGFDEFCALPERERESWTGFGNWFAKNKARFVGHRELVS